MPATTLLSTALLVSGIAGTPSYQIADLSPKGFEASKINAKGHYIGQLGVHAATLIGTTVVDLGTSGAWPESQAEGINDAGDVVGLVLARGYSFAGRAILWHKGELSFVDGVDASNTSEASAINAAGQIVGARSEIAALWDHGSVVSLGTLPNDYESSAIAINRFGQVAGTSRRGSETHPFFYDHGVMAPAGDLDGYGVGKAMALNDAGDVVGTLFNYNVQPYAWHAYAWHDGTTTDLGVLQAGATWNIANAINNSGAIVGDAMFIDGDVNSHAFVYRDGQMLDLNTLIPAHSGWVLTGASSINDEGRIVGTGTFNGQDHTFVLTPVNTALGSSRR